MQVQPTGVEDLDTYGREDLNETLEGLLGGDQIAGVDKAYTAAERLSCGTITPLTGSSLL